MRLTVFFLFFFFSFYLYAPLKLTDAIARVCSMRAINLFENIAERQSRLPKLGRKIKYRKTWETKVGTRRVNRLC